MMIKYQAGMAEYIAKTFERLLNQVHLVTKNEAQTKKLMRDPSQADGDISFKKWLHALHVYYKASAFLDCDVAFVNGAFWVIIKPFDKDKFEMSVNIPVLN